MRRDEQIVFNPETPNGKWEAESVTSSRMVCLQEVIRLRLEFRGIKPKHFDKGRPEKPMKF